MRSRNREINIFNLSMLDVISGAMGAFLIVMVVLLPYYRKQAAQPTIPEAVENLQREVQTAKAAVSQAQIETQNERARADHAEQEAQSARQALQSVQNQLSQAQAELQAANERVDRAQQEALNSQRALQAEQERNASLQGEMKKTFMLIHIHWPTRGTDIDLHVVDPKGNDFNWQHRIAPGSTGNLSVDSEYGPGNEVYTDGKASPGEYRVYVHFYAVH